MLWVTQPVNCFGPCLKYIKIRPDQLDHVNKKATGIQTWMTTNCNLPLSNDTSCTYICWVFVKNTKVIFRNQNGSELPQFYLWIDQYVCLPKQWPNLFAAFGAPDLARWLQPNIDWSYDSQIGPVRATRMLQTSSACGAGRLPCDVLSSVSVVVMQVVHTQLYTHPYRHNYRTLTEGSGGPDILRVQYGILENKSVVFSTRISNSVAIFT